MIQALINAAMGLGYIAGLFLVWVGMEMYVVDGGRFAPAFLSVVAGIALWAGLVSIGKALHRHAIHVERAARMERGR